MSKLIKAVKLYFRLSFFLPTALIALLEIIISYALFGQILDPVDGMYDDHMSLLGSFSIVHFFVAMFFSIGAFRTSTYKFTSSVSFAKLFHTTAPVIAALILSIIYDLSAFLAIALTKDYLIPADALIINSVSSVFICFIAASLNKSGLQIAAFLMIIPYFMQYKLWGSEALHNGFGLSVPAALIVALIIYTGGTALNIIIMDIWWKRPGRKMSRITSPDEDISLIKKLTYIPNK